MLQELLEKILFYWTKLINRGVRGVTEERLSNQIQIFLPRMSVALMANNKALFTIVVNWQQDLQEKKKNC